MNDPDHFLARWSRRKSGAAKVPAQATVSPPNPAERQPIAPASASGDDKPSKDSVSPPGAAPELTFDPASLPSIDSIGPQSDVRAFLKAGVPAYLRDAALRRAWSADPAIRDFRGLQENDWNFNDPNGVPGFGELSPDTDVEKMLGQLFGPQQESEGATEKAAIDDAPGGSTPIDDAPDEPTPIGESEAGTMVHGSKGDIASRDENIASRDDGCTRAEASVARRRSHGGALPQ